MLGDVATGLRCGDGDALGVEVCGLKNCRFENLLPQVEVNAYCELGGSLWPRHGEERELGKMTIGETKA